MSRRVGRISLAAALIILGTSLVISNLTQWHFAWYVARLWPVLLVLLGLEWIWVANRSEQGQSVRTDHSAIAMLAVLGFASAIWADNALRQVRFFPAPMVQMPSNMMHPPAILVQPPRLPALPAIPVPNLPGFGSVQEQVVLNHTDPVTDMKELVITDSSAAIQVERGETFLVELRVSGYGSSQAEAFRNAQRVQLQVQPGPSTRVTSEGKEALVRFNLEYRVQLPDGVDLRVRSSSGDVVVEGVRSSVNVETSSGLARISNIQGDVVAVSSSGPVNISEVSGSVRAVATSGSLHVSQGAGAVYAQSSSGAVVVQAAKIGGAYDLSAGSGSVTVQIPPDADVAVNARASSGTVSGPSWLAIGEGRNSGSGTHGTGQFPLQIRTSSGSIWVEAP